MNTMRSKQVVQGLAAIVVIVVGSQAYADPIRFDNPQGPEYFDWTDGAVGNFVHLDLTLPAVNQPNESLSSTGQLFEPGQSGALQGFQAEVFMQVGGPGDTFLLGVDEGVIIPSGMLWSSTGFTYHSAIGSELPEGEETYLGVQFDLGGGDQYGWIGVVRTVEQLQAFAWGYETEPGVPIEAGAGGGSDPTGACCGPAECQEITEADCGAMGWQYMGDDTTCDDACNAIPTVSEWGLGFMSLGMVTAGIVVFRKRGPQAKPPVA